jgi:N-acyl-D-aspartate/D-glutamate deacylase
MGRARNGALADVRIAGDRIKEIGKLKPQTGERAIDAKGLIIARKWLGLKDRGTIRAGMKADLILFDSDKVLDRSTMIQPLLEPIGILYVLVNGAVVVDGGKVTGERPGAVLRHGAAAKTGQ